MFVDFLNSFTIGFSQEFAIKYLSFSPPHLNYMYVATTLTTVAAQLKVCSKGLALPAIK